MSLPPPPPQEETQAEEEYPAVIVEPVPSAHLEQCFAAQVLVYDDETYLMQGVAEEQEVETEAVEAGEMHGGGGGYPPPSASRGGSGLKPELIPGWVLP